MLPEELIKIFELYDYEDLKLCITNAKLNSSIFTVSFEIQSEGVADMDAIGERAATYWNGASFIPESSDLKILFMGETDTYIIAENFLFIRQ